MEKNVPAIKDNVKTNKITLDEYIDKYSNPKSPKELKTLFTLLASAIGIIIVVALFFFVLKLFDIHEIVGYVGIGTSVLVFILCFIVPLCKISRTKYFHTQINITNAREAKKYNKELRENIADRMIDLNYSTEKNDWYSDAKIAPIAVARVKKDDKALSAALTDIYNTDVSKAANNMITDSALQVGLITSISQSDKVNSLIVTVSELNLIKKIVYLYGYRPNDAQMLKIYKSVLTNALLAYGVQNATSSIAGGVAKLLGGAAEAIPLISTLVGSVSAGVINGSLTVSIGFQTIRYLKREYKLQDILSGIEVNESEELEAKMMSEVKKDIINSSKGK